jgi:chemotaxis protein methyltransferase CheR
MASESDVESIEIRLLLEAINSRYGFDLRGYAQSSIQRRVRAALAKSGLGNFGELQHRVLTDAAFFADMLDELTVHVTEMFRDPPFYRAFRQRVVPILRTYPLLRIWHGGCASGEEAYANAIMLEEEGLYERAQIYATDLNPQALEHAKLGVYSAEQLRAFKENYEKSGGTRDLSMYCTEAYEQVALKESLKRNILFFQHNLVSDHVFGEMHVIFCRNVFIYFGQTLRERVLEKFAQSLCPGGFLCLGAFSEFAPEERIYRYAA